MKLFEKPQPPQSKLQEFRDGMIGLLIVVGLVVWGWNWLTGDAEPVTAAQVELSPEEAAAATEAAARKAVAEKAEAERLAAEAEAEAKAAAEATKVEAAAKAKEKAHEKRYGFHCLSGWDGSHRGLVTQVKERLHDPHSFEHDKTQTWPVQPDGRNQILMTYRAKNGFGALMLGKAVGSFDNETCDVTVDLVE
ncbi:MULTISPECIES: hypothetical protein [Paracoccus]|uniref:Uncharacterized protein n=1 Tax=Paracoccus versutus TaxID=34007 RepID=A0A3D9XJF9_PARVE|nr:MULTISPECIES: hypothetical protein [Paracoccus]REF69741.1 hypothetical protein BDD41_2455 [Paracoccus versutus]WGR57896.1 hypothetical protein E3U25_18285 [Paracoccus versutus]